MYKNNNKSQNENSKQLPFAAIFIQQQPLEHSFSVSLQQKWEMGSLSRGSTRNNNFLHNQK